MAECLQMKVKRKTRGCPDTEVLHERWEQLLKAKGHVKTEKVEYFLHCTSKKGKVSIMKDMKLKGRFTDLPKKAPLAGCRDVKGVWLTTTTADLPRKSPYGSQRLLLSPTDVFGTLRIPVRVRREMDTERDNEKEQIQQKIKLGMKRYRKTEATDADMDQPASKYTAKSKPSTPLPVPEPSVPEPSLFFECAHYYRNTQYLRLLLLRSGDPAEEWCKQNCKAVDLKNNPFLCLEEDGVIKGNPWQQNDGNCITEVLVVGDIDLDMMLRPLIWETVGTARRAGSDPQLGVLSRR